MFNLKFLLLLNLLLVYKTLKITGLSDIYFNRTKFVIIKALNNIFDYTSFRYTLFYVGPLKDI